MFLGIDSDGARMVEGISPSSGRVLSVMPFMSPCKLTIDKGGLGEGPDFADVMDRVYFREDFYDPRSRLRRGRLYKAFSQFNMPWMIVGEGASRHIDTYSKYSIWSHHQKNRLCDTYVLLGDKTRFTRWRIVDIEVLHTGEELISLKAMTAFGLLPELLDNEIPAGSLVIIRSKLQQLVDDMYVASAESTVDNCREAASAIIGAYVNQPQKDLGKLIADLEKTPYEKRMAASAALVINLLHPRRKAAEHVRLALRPIAEDDAQFAVSSVGLILVELGWGRW